MSKKASRAVPGKVISFSSLAETARIKREGKKVNVTNGYILGLRVRSSLGIVETDYIAELEMLNVPARVGIYIQRLVKKLVTAYNEIESARVKLVNSLGVKQEDGRTILHPDSPNWDKFVSEFNDLLAETTDIDTSKVILPGDTTGEHLTKLLGIFEPFISVEGVE
mgnify:CR=1 FL=1